MEINLSCCQALSQSGSRQIRGKCLNRVMGEMADVDLSPTSANSQSSNPGEKLGLSGYLRGSVCPGTRVTIRVDIWEIIRRVQVV